MGQAGAGFAQGFTSTIAQGMQLIEQTRQREEDLKLRKQLVGAQLEEHKAKTELATRALAASTDLQQLLTQTEVTGDIEQSLATGEPPARRPRPISLRDLATAIAGVDPLQAAKLLATEEKTTTAEPGRAILGPAGNVLGFVPFAPGTSPEETEVRTRGLLRSLGALPSDTPSIRPPVQTAPAVEGRAPAAPTAAPPAQVPGVTELPQVQVNVSRKGELSVTLGMERLQNPMQITEIETAQGYKQKMAVVRDLASGQITMHPLGVPVPPAVMLEAARFVDAHSGEKLAPAEREVFIAQATAALANPDKNIAQELLAGLGEEVTTAAARTPGTAYSRPLDTRKAMQAVESRREMRVKTETAAREMAQLGASGLSEEDRKALQTVTVNLANIAFLEAQFSPQEIEQFVGVLNRPLAEAQLIVRGLFGRSGSERFAAFKASNERMRGSAFGEGGKQLTPFEASVVFGYTPTGRELGGATEYVAKMRQLKVMFEISRDVRLELAKTSRGALDPAEIDRRVVERMRVKGLLVPDRLKTDAERAGKLAALLSGFRAGHVTEPQVREDLLGVGFTPEDVDHFLTKERGRGRR